MKDHPAVTPPEHHHEVVSVLGDPDEGHHWNAVVETLPDQVRSTMQDPGVPASGPGGRDEIGRENSAPLGSDQVREVLGVYATPSPPPLNHGEGRPAAEQDRLGEVGHVEHRRRTGREDCR